VIVHIGLGEMEELSVVGGRSERSLKRFTAQKIQYQINAFGLGHRLQLYIELVVCVDEYVRARQLFNDSCRINIKLYLRKFLMITSGNISDSRSACCPDSTTA